MMVELWRLASEHAQHVVEGRLADEQATLQAAEIQLAQERETWTMPLEAAENSVAHARAAQDLVADIDNDLLRSPSNQERQNVGVQGGDYPNAVQAWESRHDAADNGLPRQAFARAGVIAHTRR